jgi:serine O-acetyltransferase
MTLPPDFNPADPWPALRREAEARKSREPVLAKRLTTAILDRKDFVDALAFILAEELARPHLGATELHDLFTACSRESPAIIDAAQKDLAAVLKRDPAATSPLVPFLFFKGFHALQGWRFAHHLWGKGRDTLALELQGRIAKSFAVDIHPAARIGFGIMMDHANGIVIGETAVIEDNVSMLHDVTLGGTGKTGGDRHPKIKSHVMIGAGAKVLGNITIGEGARIASGSVVLENVPPHVTVAGVPARVIGKCKTATPAEDMDQAFSDIQI